MTSGLMTRSVGVRITCPYDRVRALFPMPPPAYVRLTLLFKSRPSAVSHPGECEQSVAIAIRDDFTPAGWLPDIAMVWAAVSCADKPLASNMWRSV